MAEVLSLSGCEWQLSVKAGQPFSVSLEMGAIDQSSGLPPAPAYFHIQDFCGE